MNNLRTPFTRHLVRTLVGVTVAAATIGVVDAGPALAKKGDIVVRGTCSGTSDAKLKLGPRERTIEFDFEVDSNVNGQPWRVVVTDNGARVVTETATTALPSGSFSIDRRTANRPGTDRFVARAVNRRTGETCTVRASV